MTADYRDPQACVNCTREFSRDYGPVTLLGEPWCDVCTTAIGSEAAFNIADGLAHAFEPISAPLAIDLFCGLGGWTDGLLAEGYYVVGFDIEQHVYGEHRYPAQLVVQDVLTLHGRQFKDAALIVASPPCQEYSYMAMPWKLAKAKAAWYRDEYDCSDCQGTGNFYRRDEDDDFLECDTCGATGHTGERLENLNRLFNACFRIQREACEAAGRHIPMVVENVRGAIPWVGRSRWNYGSFHLWGDVPALMPVTLKAQKVPGFRFDGSGKSFQSASVEKHGLKVPGMNWSGYGSPDYKPQGFNVTAAQRFREEHGKKNNGGSWFNIAHNHVKGQNARDLFAAGIKQSGISGTRANGKGDCWFQEGAAKHGSKSDSRKAASAMIAKIPLPLSRHIAATFKPAHPISATHRAEAA